MITNLLKVSGLRRARKQIRWSASNVPTARRPPVRPPTFSPKLPSCFVVYTRTHIYYAQVPNKPVSHFKFCTPEPVGRTYVFCTRLHALSNPLVFIPSAWPFSFVDDALYAGVIKPAVKDCCCVLTFQEYQNGNCIFSCVRINFSWKNPRFFKNSNTCFSSRFLEKISSVISCNDFTPHDIYYN